MPSRVTIFNHYGSAVAEVNTVTTRSYMLDNIGRCQFRVASFNNPNCSPGILQYGNFVLVEHIPTRNSDGTINGILPPWLGIILPPREWDFGLATVTAYAVESLLMYRPMPYQTVVGDGGSVFAQALAFANQLGGFPIQPGTIYSSPNNANVDLRLSAFEEILNQSRTYNQDFDITWTISSNKSITLFGNWYRQKGAVVNAVFSEGTNGNMKLPKLTEQGVISNVVKGYNQSTSAGTRISSIQKDTASAGDYGILGVNQNFTVDGQGAIDTSTLNYLYNNSRPIFTLELTALDVAKTFTSLIVGNIWRVVLKSVGFYGANIGFQGSVRLTAIEYDDWTNEAILTTQVLTAGLSEANYA